MWKYKFSVPTFLDASEEGLMMIWNIKDESPPIPTTLINITSRNVSTLSGPILSELPPAELKIEIKSKKDCLFCI